MGEKLLQGQMLSMGGAAVIAKFTWLDIVHFLTLHLVGILVCDHPESNFQVTS
jgi:hypothetical protein